MFLLIYLGFGVFVLAMMALDFGLLHGKAHVIGVREALLRTTGWVTLALGFNVFVYFLYEHNWLGWREHFAITMSGSEAAIAFLTGYIIEQSLSMDNMMVFALIFGYFHVPLAQQHRVLFWGIFGALLLRGLMIWVGGEMIKRFDWVTYVFGAILIATAVRLLLSRAEHIHPERNLAVRLARRFYPVTTEIRGGAFFIPPADSRSRPAMTPLFLALILVSTADAIFAVDSIPAIFAITRDPFIVLTSNVFAVLGLRSLYFALAGLLERFCYLKPSLVFLLAIIGAKMLLENWVHVPTLATLGIVAVVLGVGIVASLIAGARGEPPCPDGEAAPRSHPTSDPE